MDMLFSIASNSIMGTMLVFIAVAAILIGAGMWGAALIERRKADEPDYEDGEEDTSNYVVVKHER